MWAVCPLMRPHGPTFTSTRRQQLGKPASMDWSPGTLVFPLQLLFCEDMLRSSPSPYPSLTILSPLLHLRQVSHIDVDKGWCCVACFICKKLERTVSSFTCKVSDNSHAVGSLRYRVEMSVTDDPAEGVFVCFDGVMTKLHNLKASDAAAEMLAADGVNAEERQLPPFIEIWKGRHTLFKSGSVHITSRLTIIPSQSHVSSMIMTMFHTLTSATIR